MNDANQSQVPSTLGTLKQISAGAFHSCALLENDSVQCWGFDGLGRSTPPSDLGPVVQISAAYFFTCALQKNGIARCWSRALPKEIHTSLAALGPVVQIYTSTDQICVVTQQAKVHCLGMEFGYEKVGEKTVQTASFKKNMTPPPEDLEVYIEDLLPRFDFGKKSLP